MLTYDVCLVDLASMDHDKILIKEKLRMRNDGACRKDTYIAYTDVKGHHGGQKWQKSRALFFGMMTTHLKEVAGTRKRAVSDSGTKPAAKVARVAVTPSKATASNTAYSEESSEATSSSESSEATPKATSDATPKATPKAASEATPKATSEATSEVEESSEGTATSKDAPICHDPGLLSATSDFTTTEHQQGQQAKPKQLLSSDSQVWGHVGEDGRV